MNGKVYVVKRELRTNEAGHPRFGGPTMVEEVFYRRKADAVKRMREIADADVQLEIAMSRILPQSPAWANAVPDLSKDADSCQVVRADGFIWRFFVDALPLR